jgi:hypothetical protein
MIGKKVGIKIKFLTYPDLNKLWIKNIPKISPKDPQKFTYLFTLNLDKKFTAVS